MSAPVIDTVATTDGIPDNAVPIRLPVMVVEGMETADRRYIEPGTISVRDLPIPLYAATRSTHGDTGDAATWHVGAITSVERQPGTEVQRLNGDTFPDGSYVWSGTGWMYTDVPAEPAKSAYQLVKDGALRGNSVDMTEVVAEFQDEHGQLADQGDYVRISMQKGVIAATTLVGIPAFQDAYIMLDGDMAPPADEAMVAGAGPAHLWLAADLGDQCTPCSVEHLEVDGLHEFVSAAKRQKAEDAGHAMPGGRYPIDNEADLKKAIRAVGRAGGPSGSEEDRDAVRSHIIKQAKRLKLDNLIPDTWNSDGTLTASAVERDEFAVGDNFEPTVQDYSTSGMVALVPANPQMLVVPGGDPAGQLHLTLAFLGDEVDTWDADMVAAVHDTARRLTDLGYARQLEAERMREAGQDPNGPAGVDSMGPTEAQKGPLLANIFAHAVFNPNGDAGRDPATVYLLDGSGDRCAIDWLQGDVVRDVRQAVGEVNFPDQHSPYVPHVTAGYGGVPVDQLTYTGPVEFDRIRVAIGDNITDYPLGGGDAVLVASAASLPPLAWFEDPQLDGPTALTVDDDGRVYGHLATWGTCHTGFPGQCVTAPRSATNYSYFRVHATRALNANGDPVTVPVGYGTMDTGHAGMKLSASQVAAHYDNTGTAAFELAAGEDAHGIWVAGRLMPGLDEATAHKARGAAFSGDWRRIKGGMELMAALAVVTPGFPVPRALVASATPVALVAAGAVPPLRTQPSAATPPEDWDVVLNWVRDQKLAAEKSALDARFDAMAMLFATPADRQALAEVDMTLALDGDHPWLRPEHQLARAYDLADTEPDVLDVEAFAKKKNWVEKTGGLPKYIKRISKHLREKGMDQSRAIATAVNVAKKMCSTGDINFPGVQQVNAGSRAEACAAVADWERKKAQSKAS